MKTNHCRKSIDPRSPKNCAKNSIVFLLVFWIFLADPIGSLGYDIPDITLVEDEYEHRAIVELEECRVSLERRKKESHLVRYRHDCPQSLEQKLTLLKAMFLDLIPDKDDQKTIRTLFVGRILVTFPEFARRVSKAAVESPDWDPKRPWKEPGYSNKIFFNLMKKESIFPELKKIFGSLGYKIQVASVEKILMAKPQDIPFGSWLLEEGADPGTKLPFDAMTWFHLEPLPDPGLPSSSNIP